MTISQPSSSASQISFKDPQPADQKIFFLLHKYAISFLSTGVTIKLAPIWIKYEVSAEFVKDPTPKISPGQLLLT